jgi:peptidoglycan L-alanyl-D-glutamate endopeptidase CwlK
VTWDWAAYRAIAPLIKSEWAEMQAEGRYPGVGLVWGGDWVRFPDGPHWELS